MSGPVAYFHPERTRVAAALFAPTSFELGSDEDVARRVAILNDLIALHSLQEPRPLQSLPTSFDELTLADVTTEDEAATSSAGSTLCESTPFNVMHFDDLCREELGMTSPSHGPCPAATQEMDQHSHRPGSLEVSGTVEPGEDLFTDFVNVDKPDVLDTFETGQDLLFTDFVDVNMPDVLDTVEPCHDLLFTDLMNIDM
jgi:hypothetical protein